MGSDALVAIFAPKQLAPYVSLPSTAGGSTGYYSPTVSSGTSTWVETAVPGCTYRVEQREKSRNQLTEVDTPSQFTQLTTYRDPPISSVWIDKQAQPGPSTYASAASYTVTASTSTATSPNPSLASNTTAPPHGMSTGAQAGIGAGVAGGVLFLVAVGITIWLLRRRTKKIDGATAAASALKQPLPPQYPHEPNAQQMEYPPAVSMPWTPYPRNGGSDQYYNASYRSQNLAPGEYEERRLGSLMKDNKAISPHRFPNEVLRPTELEGEASRTVHEIGDGHERFAR